MPAYAQDNMQERNEIIRQQQELETLREDNERQKKALQEQKAEQEQAIEQIIREQKELFEKQRQSAETQNIIDDWNAQKSQREMQKKFERQEKYERLKNENAKAAHESAIVLDEHYYTQMITKLITGNNAANLQFPLEDAQNVAESHKAYMYRMSIKAHAGDPEAEYKLGAAYYEGDGVERDYNMAVAWLHKAAEQDNPEAQYGLFKMYTYGQGVDIDYDYAATMLHSAAENGKKMYICH